ncbi:polyamine aminopropyltransferase [Thiorhodovibrio frisius]|uniref:Polyamine aminopropyltransferase n=1 Tax=Thiorhodovibrio frisius TaxID=631362 RepID=H8YY09_9GAMM|nr:polyamine aminopropyltransferase [Thiorhodovibrio frisius]EIC23335.1 spermidine synthase [Thiorhodovibrio frisius]WPL23585.1 Spermidine synthase [Thiorhodovibrio frisius]
MLNPEEWFTEIVEDSGSAFSLRIKSKVHEEQTPYQSIEVYDTDGFGQLMVIDGFTMLSSRDNFLYHEMLAHPVLFTHQAPRHVAIIGGGDCGTLREVLKHQEVEVAVQIDIDERVTRVAEQFFPELTESNQDPRASLLFEDGIAWIRNVENASLDVIIIDSTDPVGPAEGLFTADFYRDCLAALAPGGLLVQQSESPLYHMEIIRGMYADLTSAGFADRRTLFFPQAIYPSGWWSATMAAKDSSLDDWRREAAEARGFATKYYNAAMHQAALAAPQFFLDAMAEAPPPV